MGLDVTGRKCCPNAASCPSHISFGRRRSLHNTLQKTPSQQACLLQLWPLARKGLASSATSSRMHTRSRHDLQPCVQERCWDPQVGIGLGNVWTSYLPEHDSGKLQRACRGASATTLFTELTSFAMDCWACWGIFWVCGSMCC